MKSFTSVEQSKKLAEILPIESADLWWAERYKGEVMDNGHYVVAEKPVYYQSFPQPSKYNYSQDIIKDIPCWSLAALIEQLPDDLIINGCSAVLWMGKKQVCYYRRDDDTSVFEYLSKGDNLLDAIVEMIIKLKKDNLL